MKTFKAKIDTAYSPEPVWCHHCRIRIAPYDVRTVSNGKKYHRGCYAKVSRNDVRKMGS